MDHCSALAERMEPPMNIRNITCNFQGLKHYQPVADCKEAMASSALVVSMAYCAQCIHTRNHNFLMDLLIFC